MSQRWRAGKDTRKLPQSIWRTHPSLLVKQSQRVTLREEVGVTEQILDHSVCAMVRKTMLCGISPSMVVCSDLDPNTKFLDNHPMEVICFLSVFCVVHHFSCHHKGLVLALPELLVAGSNVDIYEY